MSKFTIRLLLVLGCLCASGIIPTQGQTTNVPAASTNTPAATPPATPIALGDVAAQAQATSAKLQRDQNALKSDQLTPVINGNLAILTRQIDARTAEDASLGTSPMLSSLQQSQDVWQSLADSLVVSAQAVTQRAKEVDALIKELDQLTQTWQATLDAAKSSPLEVIQRIKAVLASIADTAKTAQAAQAKIFSVQTLVGEKDESIKKNLTAITSRQKIARAQLFEQDHPRLWDISTATTASANIVAQERVSLRTQLDAMETYIEDRLSVVLVHFFILIFLVAGCYWLRGTVQTEAEKEAALKHAARILDVPLATAILIALLATGFLYPLAPPLFNAAVEAVALIPAIIIIRRLIEPALFPILYATVLAFLADQVRHILMPAGLLSRFLFLSELLAATVFLIVVLRSRHLSTPGDQTNRLERLMRLYIHVAFVGLVIAGFANILGYIRLCILVGNGTLQSSYLAIILYATVRIADALVIAALNIRPFTRLGMVRHHKDLLYANLSIYIRWLAMACWVVLALENFQLLNPAWHGIHMILGAKFGWGSSTYKVGDTLAFPITVWAAFLLSRFIRFALEEEVYPYLNLARGIPYAASTMVHYTILVIGFFLAAKATGADLTQFYFLAGAFGVGLGFGLQNILNNFVSGIILLFERPVKVGDIVQLDATTMGTVERIGIRASVIRLTNGSEYIVPNGNLISNPVTNWTLSSCERLIEIPVTITSKVDPQHILSLLNQTAAANPAVLKNPAPQALLATFTGAALTFRLRAWIDSEEDWMKVTSDLSVAVNEALTKETITLG